MQFPGLIIRDILCLTKQEILQNDERKIPPLQSRTPYTLCDISSGGCAVRLLRAALGARAPLAPRPARRDQGRLQAGAVARPPPAWVHPSTHTSRIINSLRPCPHVQVDLPEHIYHWGFPSRPANPRWYSFFPGGAHGLRPTAGAHPGAPRRGQRRPARPGARLVHRLRDAVPR